MDQPFGGFTEEALEAYQKAVAEKEGVEFSEEGTYDFTTCIRPDGSAYGTRGKCRKGTEGEAKKEASVGPGRRDKELDRQVVGGQKAAAKIKAKLAAEPKKPEAARPSKEELDRRVEAMIKEENRRKGEQAAGKPTRKLATSQEARAAWKEAEKAVKAAKGELALVKAAVGRDKSPESKRRLLNAGAALDKAERAAVKASDKFFAASKRESAKAMTPEQRKLEREANKLTKGG